MKKVTGFILMFVIAALTAVSVPAQGSSEEELGRMLSKVASSTEFKIYEIKHQNAEDIESILPSLPILGAQMLPSRQFNTLSVYATPQVHEMLASIIEKYDVPRRTIEFQFFLVKATSLPNKGIKKDELPEKTLAVLNEVAGLTRFKNFELMDAPFLRTREGSDAQIVGRGSDAYSIRMDKVEIRGEANKHQIRTNNFLAGFTTATFSIPSGVAGYTTGSSLRMSTALELTEGEMTVIGTSQNQDGIDSDAYSIIVVVTAKVL